MMLSSPIRLRFVLAGVILFLAFSLSITPIYASENSDTARDQAKQILQDKKYGQESNGPLSDQAQRLTRWLGEGDKKGEIKKRSDREIREQSNPREQPELTPPSFDGLSTIGTVLLWVLIGVVLGAITFLIYKYFPNRRKKTPKKKSDPDDIPVDLDWEDEENVLENVTDAQILEDLSDKAEREGNLGLALRYRFRAGLLRLNDMDVITFHPSITNAQWQTIINNNSFNIVTRDFNDVTYGQLSCDAGHISRARSNWSTLVAKDQSNKRESQ